jgi:hypothetical protein
MMNRPTELQANVASLLALANIDAQIDSVIPCSFGGNNRIYRIDTTAGVFAAKQYFRHEGDTRDRLAAEYAFLDYANVAASGMTPRPFARNPELGIALYEFIEGRRIKPGEIGAEQVDGAIKFFRDLNAPQWLAAAKLPIASEACFSISEHLALIQERIDRLLAVLPQSNIDNQALAVFGHLAEVWQRLETNIRVDANHYHLSFDRSLPAEQRCISPSDFGFHNALAEPNGNTRFLDFEYAGWDDPAKTAGDFFAQLAIPVPSNFFEHFVTKIMQDFPDAERQAHRATLLRPAYQIKWCCIALNVFLPVNLARRKFADPDLDEATLKQSQLGKAQQILNSLDKTLHGLH